MLNKATFLLNINTNLQVFLEVLFVEIWLGHVNFHEKLLNVPVPLIFDVIPVDVFKPPVVFDVTYAVSGAQTEFRVFFEQAFDQVEAVAWKVAGPRLLRHDIFLHLKLVRVVVWWQARD